MKTMLKIYFFWAALFFCVGCTTGRVDASNDAGAEANIKLAIALYKEGYVKEAIQKALLAQELSPKNLKVCLGLGYLHEKVGENELARQCYKNALHLARRNGTVHNDYAVFLFNQGDYLQSLQHCLISVKDPEFLDKQLAYNNAGLCAVKLGDDRLAQQYFQKARLYGS